ncbi:MAG: AraC family transcriptional regulator [Paludibacteraceae bacterium]|nr:AraC family transcriptional regulator [Paludibacteraceae bacterium]
MHPNYENKYTTSDFSMFEWISFIPGERNYDALSVMKFHGTMEKLALPEYFFPSTYTLQIITAGSMEANINNKEYTLETNCGYFTSPDFLLKTPIPQTYIEIYILSFSREFMEEISVPFSMSAVAQIYARPTWRMSVEKTRRAVQYFELLREVVNDKNRASASALVKSFLLYLAGNYSYDLPAAPQLSRNEEITGRFLALVDANCEQHHALDWYASELCLSTRYVANTVKETLGFTASEAIERALMQRARTLLTTTTLSVQQIADTLGFQNQSHFGTFFRRHAGCSPRDFRQRRSDTGRG